MRFFGPGTCKQMPQVKIKMRPVGPRGALARKNRKAALVAVNFACGTPSLTPMIAAKSSAVRWLSGRFQDLC